MKRLLKLGTATKFRRNFFNVMRANLGSQLIILACTPLLTRLFSPTEFGLSALFISVLNIAGSICIWKFDRSVPNCRSRAHAVSLMSAGLVFLVAYCALISSILWAQPSWLKLWSGMESLGYLVYFLPVAVFFTGFRALYHSWFVKHSDMTPVSNARWVYTLFYLALSIGLGWFGYVYEGLVASQTLALLAASLFLMYCAKHVFTDLKRVSLKRMLKLVRGAMPLTTQSTVVALVNTLSRTLAIIILAQLFSVADVGKYSLMTRLVIMPIGVITAALSLSFWSRAAELARAKKYVILRNLYLKLATLLLAVSICVAIVCFLSPFYLTQILGEQWAGTEYVLMVTIPLVAGAILFSPTNHLVVLDMQRLQLIADIGRAALMLLVFIIAQVVELSFLVTVLLLSLSSLTGHLLLFFCHLYSYRKLIHS